MLVKVHQGFFMIMPYQRRVMDSCWKGHYEEDAHYCRCGIDFICDETEVKEKTRCYIEKDIEETRKTHGYNISGYTFDLPAGVYPNCADRHYDANIVYVKDMKMSDIVNVLTGEQYAQFCKEMGICGACAAVKSK